MKSKLFDYIDRDNFVYNLSGLTKLLAFVCFTFSVMFSYDIRYILFVLVLSNMAISALRKIIPDTIRIPSYIVIIASFVTIVEMVLHAYVPSVYAALGVYLPLIVVNCIILGRAEAFANKNTVLDSALDGIGMGIGFTMSLTLISLIREVFGSGTITLFAVGGFDGVIEIPGLSESPIGVLTLASGALLVMGYLKAFFQWKSSRGKK